MSISYKDAVSAHELAIALLRLPADTIVDIAQDPELNQAGPIAMFENGELSYAAERLRENDRQAIILWPLQTDDLDQRYQLEE